MADEAFAVRVARLGDARWSALERDAMAGRVPVPLPSREAWWKAHGGGALLLTAHADDGAVRGALALDITSSRALPGHRLLRALHAGAGLVGPAGDALMRGAAELARQEQRILRVNIELVLRTPEEQERVGQGMQAAGFHSLASIRHYRDTLIIDLAGSEDELLASFSTTTRRDLRGWAERPVEMRPITDPVYASRLNQLAKETFGRTGGRFEPRAWAERIALCRELPDASRLVGLFRAGREDPDALLAYAWGCAHGDHAHYDDAGSTRVDDIKVSMMYPLMWDLIRWAKQQGCSWFDMGGAVPANAKDDPRLGISDFKRRFSKEMVAVGAEWEFEPHPKRAALARRLKSLLSG